MVDLVQVDVINIVTDINIMSTTVMFRANVIRTDESTLNISFLHTLSLDWSLHLKNSTLMVHLSVPFICTLQNLLADKLATAYCSI